MVLQLACLVIITCTAVTQWIMTVTLLLLLPVQIVLDGRHQGPLLPRHHHRIPLIEEAAAVVSDSHNRSILIMMVVNFVRFLYSFLSIYSLATINRKIFYYFSGWLLSASNLLYICYCHTNLPLPLLHFSQQQ